MSLIDEYNQSMDDDGESAADPSASRRQRSEMERQLAILDADHRKLSREIEDMEAQKRKIRKQEERLRVDEGALDTDIKKLYNSKISLEDEITRIKKKLKTLT